MDSTFAGVGCGCGGDLGVRFAWRRRRTDDLAARFLRSASDGRAFRRERSSRARGCVAMVAALGRVGSLSPTQHQNRADNHRSALGDSRMVDRRITTRQTFPGLTDPHKKLNGIKRLAGSGNEV